MMRVRRMASWNLAGSAWPIPAPTGLPGGLKTVPSTHNAPTRRITAVPTRLESSAASRLLLVARYSVNVGTKAEEERLRRKDRASGWDAKTEGKAS